MKNINETERPSSYLQLISKVSAENILEYINKFEKLNTGLEFKVIVVSRGKEEIRRKIRGIFYKHCK